MGFLGWLKNKIVGFVKKFLGLDKEEEKLKMELRKKEKEIEKLKQQLKEKEQKLQKEKKKINDVKKAIRYLQEKKVYVKIEDIEITIISEVCIVTVKAKVYLHKVENYDFAVNVEFFDSMTIKEAIRDYVEQNYTFDECKGRILEVKVEIVNKEELFEEIATIRELIDRTLQLEL